METIIIIFIIALGVCAIGFIIDKMISMLFDLIFPDESKNNKENDAG